MDGNRTRYGLGVPAVGHLVSAYGFPSPGTDDLKDALEYLTNKKLIEEVMKGISRENRAWRITDAGIAFVDQHP